MAFIAPAIGVASSLLGGILGSSAAKKAAEVQGRFNTILAGQTAKAGEQITNRYTDLFNTSKRGYDPYTKLGESASASLQNLLGLGGPGAGGANAGLLTSEIPLNLPGATNLSTNLAGFKFDPSSAAIDPSLAFRLGEGQKAIERSAAAKGGLYGGGTGKSLENYAQGLASEEYQNMFNRGLTEYNTGLTAQQLNAQRALTNWQTGTQNALNLFNATNTNRQNIYSRLFPSVGMGLNTAQDIAGLNTTYGNQAAQSEWQSREAQNALWQGVANAQAGGFMGSGNAWQSAIGGIGNALSGGFQLAQLKNMLGQQASGGPSQGNLPTYSGGFGIGGDFAPTPELGTFAPSYGG